MLAVSFDFHVVIYGIVKSSIEFFHAAAMVVFATWHGGKVIKCFRKVKRCSYGVTAESMHPIPIKLLH